MKTQFILLKFVLTFTLLLYLLTNQVLANNCDPGFTFDSAEFSLETTEDFENTGFTPPYEFTSLDLPAIIVSHEYNLILEKHCGAQVPVATTFVQSYGNAIIVSPKNTVFRLGLNFGHQDFSWWSEGNIADVTVVDSTGTTHSCQAQSAPITITTCQYSGGQTYTNSGLGGFIGFDTNDANVSIVSMSVQMPDGGIDNVRCLGCDGVVISACSPESLRDDIEALSLNKGLENALLSKLNAAVKTKKSGVNTAAIGVYGAMKNQISTKSTSDITEANAADLISCIDELIIDLESQL